MSANLRIGFYEFIDESTTVPEVVEREFELGVYNEMREKTNVLWESQSFYFAWSLVLNNYKEYVSVKTKRQKINFHPRVLMGGDYPYSRMSDVCRVTINFLAAASTFLMMSQRLVKNYFGEGSEIYDRWNSHRRQLHASSNGYQICYELRNFSQHYQIPLSGVNLDFKNGYAAGGESYIIIKELLDSGYNWKGFRQVLESQESQVCLSELLEDYYNCLKEVFLSGHSCFEEKIESSRDYIKVIIGEFGLPEECTPVIFTLDPKESDFNRLKQEYMPVGLHKYIDGIINCSK